MAKRRLIEWGKSLLILALSVSAVWLVTLSPLYIGSPLEERMQALFASEEVVESVTQTVTVAARPMAAVVTGEGGRYGVQYDSAAVQEVFENFAPLLGEALGAHTPKKAIREADWKAALSRAGIYFDFGNAIPVTALASWFQEEDEWTDLSGDVRRILLAAGDGENDVSLFWQDAQSGAFYTCATDLDRKLQLLSGVSVWMPNAAFFAYEDARYRACASYTLITDAAGPAVYSESISLSAANTAGVQQVLEGLSYSFASGASYPISGGTRYTDGVNTFQLTDTGVLTYHAAEPYFGVSEEEEAAGVTQCIEIARRLTENTLGKLSGEAELLLTSVKEEDGEVVVTFGYSLGGIPVFVNPDGWAAQFCLREGCVTSFTLYFRGYTKSGETTELLPELQAAAALGALDTKENELILAYHDVGGTTVSAGWLAR